MRAPNYVVIIPTSDRLCDLRRAICSVCNQSLSPSRIYLVNDGRSSIERYVQAWSISLPVTIIETGGSLGAAVARNRALDEIAPEVEFVAFLDDDDLWLPDKMERQIKMLKEAPGAVLCGCSRVRTVERKPYLERITAETIQRWGNFENVVGSFSFLVVRLNSKTRSVRIATDFASCQDWDYIMKIKRFGGVVVDPVVLAIYRAHAGPRISSKISSVTRGFESFRAAWSKEVGEDVAEWWRVRASVLNGRLLAAFVSIPRVSGLPRFRAVFSLLYLATLSTIGRNRTEMLNALVSRVYDPSVVI